MQQDFNGFRIGSHDDELGNTTIERFGSFVGTLFDLLVVGSLLLQEKYLKKKEWSEGWDER